MTIRACKHCYNKWGLRELGSTTGREAFSQTEPRCICWPGRFAQAIGIGYKWAGALPHRVEGLCRGTALAQLIALNAGGVHFLL